MPSQAGSPGNWATVDFDSDGEQDENPDNYRVYLDPWDNEAYGLIQDPVDSTHGENLNSFAGEPVSASFYYVPTKNYDSGEEPRQLRRKVSPEEVAEYSLYGRKLSRPIGIEYPPEMPIYERPRDRRRSSMYVGDMEPIYGAHYPYEPLYGPAPPIHPGYNPAPRSRMSLPHHPEYMMTALGNASDRIRRYSRLTDAYDHFGYETLTPDYEDWARPFPKTAPDNFRLSRYGHLKIDYSCSWNSLDRIIRNQ